jgi:hypothetical protein
MDCELLRTEFKQLSDRWPALRHVLVVYDYSLPIPEDGYWDFPREAALHHCRGRLLTQLAHGAMYNGHGIGAFGYLIKAAADGGGDASDPYDRAVRQFLSLAEIAGRLFPLRKLDGVSGGPCGLEYTLVPSRADGLELRTIRHDGGQRRKEWIDHVYAALRVPEEFWELRRGDEVSVRLSVRALPLNVFLASALALEAAGPPPNPDKRISSVSQRRKWARSEWDAGSTWQEIADKSREKCDKRYRYKNADAARKDVDRLPNTGEQSAREKRTAGRRSDKRPAK